MPRRAPLLVLLILASGPAAQGLPSAGALPPLSDPLAEVLESVGDPFIQPGARMVEPEGCTLNFVFRHSGTGRFAIGTAGHCVHDVGQAVSIRFYRPARWGSPPAPCAPGSDPVCTWNRAAEWAGGNLGGRNALEPGYPLDDVVPIGRVVHRTMWDNRSGNDFALIEIDPALDAWVRPDVKLVGGPCGAYAGQLGGGPVDAGLTMRLGDPMPLRSFGHGRAGPAWGTERWFLGHWDSVPDTVFFTGPVTPGDSGSPIRAWMGEGVPGAFMGGAGQAVGIVTNGLVAEGFGTSIARVQELIGPEWALQDDPRCAGAGTEADLRRPLPWS